MNANVRALMRSLGPAVGLIATWCLFAVLAGATFTSWSNQQTMLIQTVVVGIAAVGATWIIISGGIDLSVGSNIALGTMVIALVVREFHNPWLAAALGIAGGAFVGAMIGALVIGELLRVVTLVAAIGVGAWFARSQGALVGVIAAVAVLAVGVLASKKLTARVPLSPFIVTLGLWGALRGLAKGIGGNQPVYADSEASMRAMESMRELMYVGDSGLLAVLPVGVWVLIALAAVAGLAMRFTVFGRHVFAVGSNEETARLCGLRVERIKRSVYVIGLACAGLAAVFQTSYLSMGDPTTAQGYELKVIAAVVIGGASLSGGQGSILGTMIGALIMTVVDNGCTKLELDNWVQEVVTGVIIVAAVVLDSLRRRTQAN